MSLQYLVGLKIGPDSRNDITVKEFHTKAKEFEGLDKVQGLELRFKGSIDQNGYITRGPNLEQITDICDYAIDSFGLVNLHLSEFGLRVLTGQCKGKKIDNSIDFMNQHFNFIIGHLGEHENLFGQVTAETYANILTHTRFSTKKVFWNSISDILSDGEILPSLQRKFLIENGTKTYNCLPRVYDYAKSNNLNMTLDIGHLISGFLETDPTTKAPYDNIHYYVVRGKGGKPFYKNKHLYALGSKVTHLHIHGRGPEGDHVVLSKETLRGVQIGIVDRLLCNKAYINTGTVEHRKELCNKEDVSKTIKAFENMFC